VFTLLVHSSPRNRLGWEVKSTLLCWPFQELAAVPARCHAVAFERAIRPGRMGPCSCAFAGAVLQKRTAA
jgi:hypothetical protein